MTIYMLTLSDFPILSGSRSGYGFAESPGPIADHPVFGTCGVSRIAESKSLYFPTLDACVAQQSPQGVGPAGLFRKNFFVLK